MMRPQQIERRHLRDANIQVLNQLETDSTKIAVVNALSALDAQYAEARRAQVALEDALPDGEALEATIREWHELSNEVFGTRNQPGIFLKEKGNGPAVNPKQTASLTSAAEQIKPARVRLPKFDGDILQFKSFWGQFERNIHQREGLSDITKFLHLRSCLSGSALKAIEGVTIWAENYPEVVQTLNT
ncbi:hypothetical protein T03_8117 [Trichinella britovi]|uniref:Uncharacterized protein n=1 Tax=Trichinella britovi TaxID=45882 RepID=A0A0V1C5Y1_TRIBR|nr:hypothetical protein T03_8117 [Trichinella britovi]